MKKYLLITIILMLTMNYSFSAVDTSKCDEIKGILKKGEKIDCLIALKLSAIKKQYSSKDLSIINNKIDTLNARKKKFDEENKTLWNMYKNKKKSDK